MIVCLGGEKTQLVPTIWWQSFGALINAPPCRRSLPLSLVHVMVRLCIICALFRSLRFALLLDSMLFQCMNVSNCSVAPQEQFISRSSEAGQQLLRSSSSALSSSPAAPHSLFQKDLLSFERICFFTKDWRFPKDWCFYQRICFFKDLLFS